MAKQVHTIQIKANNGNFVDYTGNLGDVRTVHTVKKMAGKALAELQERTKGHGFVYRINTTEIN